MFPQVSGSVSAGHGAFFSFNVRYEPLTSGGRRADGEVDYGPDRDSELTAGVNLCRAKTRTLALSWPFCAR